ncbi:MAG TPA: tRNA-dihydrouridine synthase family protein [Candidatus Thermoplasmatota archaeon]|nr:tRNA-dihydrouridine synthase family protein [Candidatus Thermoplasmatota archaeon]
MPDLLRPLAIGRVRLPNNLVLSPMAGFSDLALRVLARRHGAGLVCSEMVSATSVEREVPGTLVKMRTLAEEAPMSIQLFGTDPARVADAARDVGERCAILGFNMGCPAHQIKRQGCGAALLDRPALAMDLVRAIKGASDKPLLVKMRAGNGGPMDVVAFARGLEAAGADGLIFHARTAKMGYSGKSDWDLIRAVKEAVSIPVVGNGDVVDGASAKAALERSGADGLALGRAALGDPRVFGRIARHLATGEEDDGPVPREQIEDFEAYVAMARAAGIGEPQILRQAQAFTKGFRDATRLRSELSRGVTPEGALERMRAAVERAEAWRAARATA